MVVASFSSRQKLHARNTISFRNPMVRDAFLYRKPMRRARQFLLWSTCSQFNFYSKMKDLMRFSILKQGGPCKTYIMSKRYKSKHRLSYRASAMYKNIYPRWYVLMILTWRWLGGASVMTAEHALRKTSGSRITCKTQYVVKLGDRPLFFVMSKTSCT